MYKVRTCRLAIRSVRRRPSLSAITLHLLPNRQCRSRPTLCAVRYAPGGRGHAITNWQCISHVPPSEVSGIGEAYRAEPDVSIRNSKVINNQCSTPNVYNYFKAHYQYTICSFRWHTFRPHIRTPRIFCICMKYNIIRIWFQTTL